MSAIKSCSNENVISGVTEGIETAVKPIGCFGQLGKINEKGLIHQQLAKKIMKGLEPAVALKPVCSSAIAQDRKHTEFMAIPTLEQVDYQVFIPSLEHKKVQIEPEQQVVLCPLDHKNEQIELEQQVDIEEELRSDHVDTMPLDDRLLDDEIPLINMSGLPLIPFRENETIQHSNHLISQLTPSEHRESTASVLNVQENQEGTNGELFDTPPKNAPSSRLMAELPLRQLARSPLFQAGSPVVLGKNNLSQLTQPVSVPQVQINIGSVLEDLPAENSAEPRSVVGYSDTAESHSLMTSERFLQNLAKIEKNQPVLQEITDIEHANIIQSNRVPMEIGVMTQTSTQVPTTIQESTSISQQVEKWIEHSAAIENAQLNENKPRTLTYTFQQWKNTPSVTFELATKTDVIATTYSQEVQQILQDNKHLLHGEKSVYFRHDQGQEHGRQHSRQQEQHQQEEE